MNIFITGAAGYVGGSIAHVLLGAGHAIRGLVRNPEKLQRLAVHGEIVIEGPRNGDPALLPSEFSAAQAACP